MIPGWLTGIGIKLAAIGAAILAVGLLVLRIFSKGEAAGKAKVEAADAKITQTAVAKAQQAQAKVEAKTDDAVLREAEDKWTKPN